MKRHTAGPWIQDFHIPPHSADGYWRIFAPAENIVVADITETSAIDANASLITAAPDLLAACENVLDHFEQLRIVGAEGIAEERLRLVLEGVIAKARGEG